MADAKAVGGVIGGIVLGLAIGGGTGIALDPIKGEQIADISAIEYAQGKSDEITKSVSATDSCDNARTVYQRKMADGSVVPISQIEADTTPNDSVVTSTVAEVSHPAIARYAWVADAGRTYRVLLFDDGDKLLWAGELTNASGGESAIKVQVGTQIWKRGRE